MQKSAQIYHKLEEKRAELVSLTEIKNYTETLTLQLESLESKLDEMVDGAESVNAVLSTWPNVIKSISMASLGLHNYSQKDYEEKQPLPETLLRIRLKKDEEEGQESGAEAEVETKDNESRDA